MQSFWAPSIWAVGRALELQSALAPVRAGVGSPRRGQLTNNLQAGDAPGYNACAWCLSYCARGFLLLGHVGWPAAAGAGRLLELHSVLLVYYRQLYGRGSVALPTSSAYSG